MNGAALQLVANNSLESYITDDPHVTFFNFVHKRYSPFYMEDKIFNMTTSNYTIPVSGDLIYKISLRLSVTQPIKKPTFKNINDILKIHQINWKNDHNIDDIITMKIYEEEIKPLLNNINLENIIINQINGVNCPINAIDVLDGVNIAIGKLISESLDIDLINILHRMNKSQKDINKILEGDDIFVPLPFWFSRQPELALPIILLQNNPIVFTMKLKPTSLIVKSKLIVQYIYFDKLGRSQIFKEPNQIIYRFIKLSFNKVKLDERSILLSYKTSENIKYIFWKIQNPISDILIKMNNLNREKITESEYYKLLQPYKHKMILPNDVYLYSFCLYPEATQPSGTFQMNSDMNFTVKITFKNIINNDDKISTWICANNIIFFDNLKMI